MNLLSEAKKETEVPIIASITCMSASEWVVFAKDLENAGADALELNLFFVPTDPKKTSEEIEQHYLRIVSEVRKNVKIPISVKVGFNFSNLIAMADRLTTSGADALVMFNRFYEPDVNLEKLELTSSEVFSCPEDIRRSMRWIGLISSQLPNVQIAAGTGIHNGEAVIKQLLVGAQVTQICSSVYINGTQVIAEMINDLTAFMKKRHFKKIEDFRGRLSYKKHTEPGHIRKSPVYEVFRREIAQKKTSTIDSCWSFSFFLRPFQNPIEGKKSITSNINAFFCSSVVFIATSSRSISISILV